MSTRPITLTVNEDGHKLTITASPARFQEILAATKMIPRITLKKARAAALRPAEKRAYPKFKEGMSTAEYVAAYHQQNAMRNLITEGFFQPLSNNPQFTQVGDCIEESI